MEKRHKILILDDDNDWLTVSREMLAALPSRPEILTANTGKRALTLLESEPVRLLICDLKMPRIDGLQILSIVRRRYPELRTVVLSSDRKSTRLNSSHANISYAVFCLKK